MVFKIKSSVNSGICITLPDNKKVWVDFYPSIRTPLWGFMSDSDWEETKKDPEIFPPDTVLTTHCHPDHFSLKRTAELMKIMSPQNICYPAGGAYSSSCQAVMSGDSLSCDKITGDFAERQFGKLCVRFIKSTHSGKQFSDVPHYSIMLTYGGKNIFISGDAHVAEGDLTDRLSLMRTDLAVLNFPWATLSRGRELIEEAIRPSHVLLVHLPEASNDPYCYRDAAFSQSSLLKVPDVRLLTERGANETYIL